MNEAVEQNPYDPQGLALLANAKRVVGADPADSLRMMERAMRISPRDPRSHRWFHYAGWCHWKLGELDKMEETARNAIELYSDAPAQWVELTCALCLQGKIAEAREAAKVLKKLSPVFTPDGFYEIARRFYGSRFAGPVQADYRALLDAAARDVGVDESLAGATVRRCARAAAKSHGLSFANRITQLLARPRSEL